MMKNDIRKYLEALEDKFYDKIQKLNEVSEDREVRDRVLQLCIELKVVDHSKPENLPEDLKVLIGKIEKCCVASDLDITFTVETNSPESIQQCKANFLLLNEMISDYLEGGNH